MSDSETSTSDFEVSEVEEEVSEEISFEYRDTELDPIHAFPYAIKREKLVVHFNEYEYY